MEIPNLALFKDFEWDDGNRGKVSKRMDIPIAESAFLGEPQILFDAVHSKIEPRWFLMNRVDSQHVFLVFTLRKNKIRILSARYMHAKEVKKYAQKIS